MNVPRDFRGDTERRAMAMALINGLETKSARQHFYFSPFTIWLSVIFFPANKVQ